MKIFFKEDESRIRKVIPPKLCRTQAYGDRSKPLCANESETPTP